MPVYQYQGQYYDMSETDPEAAKAKIQEHLGSTESKAPTSVKQALENVRSEIKSGLRQSESVASDIAAPITKPKEYFTEPSKDQGWSWGELGTSVGIGAGLGAKGGIPGAVAGGAIGGVSDVASQLTRMSGGSRALQDVAGLGAGLGTSVAKEIVGAAGSKLAPEIKALLPTKIKTAFGMAETPELSGAEKTVRERQFGVKPEPTGMPSTKYTDETQQMLRDRLSKAGMNVPADQNVSEYVKNNLFSSLDTLRSSGQEFYKSPEARNLMQDLSKKLQSGDITKGEFKYIFQRLGTEQLQDNPSQAMWNLVKHGGVWDPKLGRIERKISGNAQQALEDSFGNYMKRTTNTDMNQLYNRVRQSEYKAAAADAIPDILEQGFKNTPLFRQHIRNLNTDTGREEFVTAFNQYIGSLESPMKMQKFFSDRKDVLRRVGLLNDAQISDIQKRITNLPKDISAEKRKLMLKNIVGNTLRGALSAKVSSAPELENQ
jgi:hypothetical protein